MLLYVPWKLEITGGAIRNQVLELGVHKYGKSLSISSGSQQHHPEHCISVHDPNNHHTFFFCLVAAQTFFVDGRVYCSARNHGSPDSADCPAALVTVPRDTTDQWLLGQQLRPALLTADWRSRVGGWPSATWESLVQLPKW